MDLNAALAKVWHGLWSVWDEVRKFALDNPLDPMPLRRTFVGYNTVKARADFRAGFNVALLGICQGMAFASMAGLPLIYGVMCSAIAALVGPWLASSKHTVLGPTNATGFMIFSYFASNPTQNQLQQMPMLVFLVGALLILGAYFRIADLAQYISRTVIVAYVTGASVMIIINQAPYLIGVQKVAPGAADGPSASSGNVIGNIFRFFAHLEAANYWVLLVALTTGACYGLLRWKKPRWPAFAISLFPGALLALLLKKFGILVPTFSGAEFGLESLLPPFPAFVTTDAASQFSQLFGLAVAVAFVSNLENSVMAKTLASRGNYRVDANQDMLSLGVANLACAYLAGMPASGSLTRSALNFESGARTAIASLVSGALCLTGAFALAAVVVYLPRAVLAMLVIAIAISLIHRRQIRICLRATKSDAFVFLVTFTATLLVPLHVAIFTGVGVAVMLYLRKASRPSLVEYEFNQEGNLAEARSAQRQHASISIVHVEGDLFFGAAELFRTQIQRTCSDPNLRVIILRLKNARHLDATSVMALEELVQTMRGNGRDLIISGAGKDVYRVLRDSGVLKRVGRENFFMGSAQNPNISTRNALKRAQEIIGVKEADVHIYFDPRHAKKE